MSEKPSNNDNVLTPEFRVSFAHVFTPQKAQEADKKDKYGLTMLFAKDADLSGLKKAAQAALEEKFGVKMKDDTFRKRLRSPFRDQGEKAYDGYVPGAIFVNATSIHKPQVVDAKVQDIIDTADFYSGCYARATVRAFAYEQKGNVGVAFGLQNVQKLRDGESLSGRKNAQEEFAPVESAPSSGGMFD